MRRTILIYGTVLAVLVALLKTLEYRFLYRQLTIELYMGAVGVLFTALGIWMGHKISQRKKLQKQAGVQFRLNEVLVHRAGISKREYEVLTLMATGLSNQEIADALFVSLNTVKTHSSNLFSKLDVTRRTQAILKAKEMGLIA